MLHADNVRKIQVDRLPIMDDIEKQIVAAQKMGKNEIQINLFHELSEDYDQLEQLKAALRQNGFVVYSYSHDDFSIGISWKT